MRNALSIAFLALLAIGLFIVDPGHGHAATHAVTHFDLSHGLGLAGLGLPFFIGNTNKVQLRSIDEFMADYTPVYAPIYPLFLGKSQAFSEDVGQINFKRLDAIGDIRTKHLTPKDTEIRQISVSEGSKTFKKYFLANQYQQSALQDRGAIEDVVRQVLDEHQKQMDELFLLGEGTSNSDVVNNGLFWSGDSNWIENSPETISGTDKLPDLHATVLQTAQQADAVSGRKVILFYGTSILPLFDGVYASAPVPFKKVLQDVLGGNYTLAKIPAAITPASANGWIIANQDQVKLNYTALPSLKAQGVNEEKMYAWFNFMMGSCMLETLAYGAVVKTPATVS